MTSCLDKLIRCFDLTVCLRLSSRVVINRPYPSCFKTHHESEAKYKVFTFMKISFHSYANKTNFHVKSFARSLAFVMTLTTNEWRIECPKQFWLGLVLLSCELYTPCLFNLLRVVLKRDRDSSMFFFRALTVH